MKNLNMMISWYVFWYGLDHEWRWGDDWLRGCSWFAAQEAAKLEQQYSKQRVRERRRAVRKPMGQEGAKSYEWSK
eukprot:4280811-Pyramimonas_sp.AAC.1